MGGHVPPTATPRLTPAKRRWHERVRVWAHRGPWHYAAAITGAALAVASVLPIWEAWYFGDWEATGDRATFWGMLFSLVFALITQPSAGKVFTFFGWNFAVLAALAVVSLGAGRWLGRRAGCCVGDTNGV